MFGSIIFIGYLLIKLISCTRWNLVPVDKKLHLVPSFTNSDGEMVILATNSLGALNVPIRSVITYKTSLTDVGLYTGNTEVLFFVSQSYTFDPESDALYMSDNGALFKYSASLRFVSKVLSSYLTSDNGTIKADGTNCLTNCNGFLFALSGRYGPALNDVYGISISLLADDGRNPVWQKYLMTGADFNIGMHTCQCVGKKLFSIGGYPLTDKVYRGSLTRFVWTDLSTVNATWKLHRKKHSFRSVYIPMLSKIWVSGGYLGENQYTADTESIDVTTGAVVRGPSMRIARGNHIISYVLNGDYVRLVVFGGYTTGQEFSDELETLELGKRTTNTGEKRVKPNSIQQPKSTKVYTAWTRLYNVSSNTTWNVSDSKIDLESEEVPPSQLRFNVWVLIICISLFVLLVITLAIIVREMSS